MSEPDGHNDGDGPSTWHDPNATLYEMYLANTRDDLDRWHHYFPIYERYFSKFRHRPMSILEIGVYRGGSLRLWRAYFGEQARITGIDIDPECLAFRSKDAEVFIGDQADAAFLTRAALARGPFDIIIDDGGHTARQQIISMETLLPHVKDGGIYLVEDTHTSLWPEFMDHPLGISFLDVATRMAERLTWWHRDRRSFTRFSAPPEMRGGDVPVPDLTRTVSSIAFYDSMVVFEKNKVPEPHRERR
jgi:SAM-dependent methyltransferase